MIVDDDHDLCASLWDVLRDRGYRVCFAHDATQAAGRLGDQPYRVVLVDMKLSDSGGGEQVYQQVRKANPQTRVVLITGYPTEMDQLVQKLVAEGADAVCYKPFDMPKLLDALKNLASSS